MPNKWFEVWQFMFKHPVVSCAVLTLFSVLQYDVDYIFCMVGFTDRNPVRSLLEFSTKAAFPSTTLESLVLDWEVKWSQIFEQAST